MISVAVAQSSELSFQRTLQRLADATDRPLETVLRQQGRLLAGDLAFHIQPRGLAAATGTSFRRSISQKITSLYRPVGWLFGQIQARHSTQAADAIISLIRRGRPAEAQTILNSRLRIDWPSAIIIGEFDGGALHRRFRFSRRRRHPIHIVPDYSVVNTYIRETTALAGWAKGSLLNAGKQLDGRSRGPKWVSGHHGAPGRGILRRLPKGFHGEIQSHVSYIREALPFSSELEALRVRQETAEKQLKRITDANLRRAMRGGR